MRAPSSCSRLPCEQGPCPTSPTSTSSFGTPSTSRSCWVVFMLPLLEEVRVSLKRDYQAAALESLRCLPHLRRLVLKCQEPLRVAPAFPPFIPPSLKSLSLDVGITRALESLLHELPALLEASGAGLEELEMAGCDPDLWRQELSAQGGHALAQVLRECSSTLKILEFQDPGGRFGPACISGLLTGLMSCCATLEVLRCPWALFSALPATCPALPRLTELHVRCGRVDIDLDSPAWDIMADGRLPALASFSATGFKGLVWGQGAGRLAGAFEGVAGTLRRLTLIGTGTSGG
jgi:hypothetical protein